MMYRALPHEHRSVRAGYWDIAGQGLATLVRIPTLAPAGLFATAQYECNVWGWLGDELYPNTGPSYRDHRVACPGCGSLNRHRSLMAALLTATGMPPGGKTVIEVAPMRRFEAVVRAQHDLHDTSSDLEPHTMEREDMTELRFASATVDLFVCLLEHIPDASAALQEIRRALVVGGSAVLEVPVCRSARTAVEYDRPDPRGVGHVRQYETDFADVIASAGVDVRAVSIEDTCSNEVIDRFRLSREPIYLAFRGRDA